MYSTGKLVNVQEPKTPYNIPSTSSTSISSSSTSSSSYSMVPMANLLTPPSSSLTPSYKSTQNPSNIKYINIPTTNFYESNQQFVFNTPVSTPNACFPTLSYYSNKTEMEVTRMIPGSASPSGSLSDTTEISLNNSHSKVNFQISKSDYYITKREKLIPTSTSKTNLYIRGLSENTTDEDLYEMCKKYGEIKSTKSIIDKQTLKCKGYGFVDFKSLDDAKIALADLKKEQKDVQLAKQREQDPTNLYFANLPEDIDETMLANMLKTQFSANVSSTRIMRERCGSSKGVGFARLDDINLCDQIIQQLNNKPFPDHVNLSKIISVKLADSGGILKPKFKNSNNNNSSLEKENSINIVKSGQNNGDNSNDGNNNYSNNNYNNYQTSPQATNYAGHGQAPYSSYIENNYTSAYPLYIENYQTGQTIVQQHLHTQQQQPPGQLVPHPVATSHSIPPFHPTMHRTPVPGPYMHPNPQLYPHHQSSPSQHYHIPPHYYPHHNQPLHTIPYYYYPPQQFVQLKQNEMKPKQNGSHTQLSQQFSQIALNSNQNGELTSSQ